MKQLALKALLFSYFLIFLLSMFKYCAAHTFLDVDGEDHMTTAMVVCRSVNINTISPSQDHTNPDDLHLQICISDNVKITYLVGLNLNFRQ